MIAGRHRVDKQGVGDGQRSRGRRATVVVTVWAAVVLAGLARLAIYDATPGAASGASARQAIAGAGDAPSLVVFIHPFCPCSRATLDVLDEIVSRRPSSTTTTTTIVFADVTDGDVGPDAGDAWRRAARIRGARLVRDDADGTMARRFDARTSGQLVALDARGSIAYAGGITPSRGHAGDSAGRLAVESVLEGVTPATSSGPVFGCELR